MPSTVLEVLQSAPLNATVMAVCSGIWFWMWNKRYGYEDVSTSYHKVVNERQYYRIITATFCHLNFLHLVFNMGSLYTVGVLESALGSYYYFHRTILLIFLSEAIWMLITYVLVKRFNMERFATSSAVGYSGVIFGWMTILQLYQPSFAIPLPGLNIPITFAPFISLVITQMLVPQASFLGHLSGIFAGYLIGFGLFDWFNGYWFFTSLAYAIAIVLLSLKANGNLSSWLRCVSVSPQFMQHTGMGAPTSSLGDASAPSSRRYMTSDGVLRVDRHVDGAAVDNTAAPHVAIPVAGAPRAAASRQSRSAPLRESGGLSGGAPAGGASASPSTGIATASSASIASQSPVSAPDVGIEMWTRSQPQPAASAQPTAAPPTAAQAQWVPNSQSSTPVLLGFGGTSSSGAGSAPLAALVDHDPFSLNIPLSATGSSGQASSSIVGSSATGSGASDVATATVPPSAASVNGGSTANILAAAAARRLQAAQRRGANAASAGTSTSGSG